MSWEYQYSNHTWVNSGWTCDDEFNLEILQEDPNSLQVKTEKNRIDSVDNHD